VSARLSASIARFFPNENTLRAINLIKLTKVRWRFIRCNRVRAKKEQQKANSEQLMNPISGVSSTTNPYSLTNQTGFDQVVKDFDAISNALQSGDISSAQTALATFQKDLQNTPQTSGNQPFANNGQANTDYQSLVGALQNGDLSNAKRAFVNLQADLNGAQATTKASSRGHHRHGSGGVSTSTLINSLATNSISASQLPTSLIANPLTASNLNATA
jgi:soluble cytochrome b562